MAKSAVELIANRINVLLRDKKAIDIAINELQGVLQSLGGTPLAAPMSLDAQWGSDVEAVSGDGKTADGKAPEVVASPKSGTPVETGVATLRKRLGGNGR